MAREHRQFVVWPTCGRRRRHDVGVRRLDGTRCRTTWPPRRVKVVLDGRALSVQHGHHQLGGLVVHWTVRLAICSSSSSIYQIITGGLNCMPPRNNVRTGNTILRLAGSYTLLSTNSLTIDNLGLLDRISKSNFGVVRSWPLTSWPQKSVATWAPNFQ